MLSLSLTSQSIDLNQLSLQSKQPIPLPCLLHQGADKAEVCRLQTRTSLDSTFRGSCSCLVPLMRSSGLWIPCFSSLGILLCSSKENSTTNNCKLCLQQWFYSHHSFQHHVLLWSFPTWGARSLCTVFLCAAPIPCLRRAVTWQPCWKCRAECPRTEQAPLCACINGCQKLPLIYNSLSQSSEALLETGNWRRGCWNQVLVI